MHIILVLRLNPPYFNFRFILDLLFLMRDDLPYGGFFAWITVYI